MKKPGGDRPDVMPTPGHLIGLAARLFAGNRDALDELRVEEAPRINAEDEKDGAKEKADTKNPATKDFMARFSDMGDEHEKLANQFEAKM